ncbi:MAG: helix-turn-helix domain-containing protein, partial [Caulobacteraceae bacterium]
MSTSLRREIDLHLGALIRLRRNELGVSQASLAHALGVSFQQVQKYERGTNRVSASALYAIAGTLGVAPAFFYEGISMIAGAAPEEGPLVGDQARVSSA